MLKHVFLNNKKLPVPVPIRTLEEALRWAEASLLSADRIITKVTLDGETHYDVLGDTVKSGLALNAESNLHLQIDSARDLSLQTIDVLRNLSSVLEGNLKPIAVLLWQYSGRDAPTGVPQILDDINLAQSLLDHLLGILDSSADERLTSLAVKLTTTTALLGTAAHHSEWRQLARVLLNQFEPELLMLQAELGNLQRNLFDARTNERPRRR